MALQDVLLSVLRNAGSRKTGLFYLLVGLAYSGVEYIITKPRPEYYLTNGLGNSLIYVGLATLIVGTLERWKKQYDDARRRKALLQAEIQRLKQSALANFPILDEAFKGPLKAQILTGQQRFLVGSPNGVLGRLVDLHIVIRPEQLGQSRSSGVYMINPAIWDNRQEISDDTSINGNLRPGWFSRRI